MSEEQASGTEGIKPDFSHIVSVFGMQSLIACGKIMNPASKKFETDLLMAQYYIGVLEILEQKTTGNLNDAEAQLFKDMLHQVRMAYIDASRGTGKVTSE